MNSNTRFHGECRSILLVAVLLTGLHTFWLGEVAAQNIGVNFVGGAGAAGTLSASDVAGVPGFAQAFWNNAPGASGSFLSNLVDSTGQQTSIDAELRAISGVGTTGAAGVGADFTLMQGYLRSTPAGIGIILSSIPYPVYDVIVYLTGPLSTSGSRGRLFYRAPNFDVSPSTGEFYGPLVEYAPTFTGTFAEASPTNAGNYYRFSGLTYDSIGVGSIYFSLGAVQIVPVPEPSTTVLLAVSVACLASYRLRARKRKG